MANRKTVIAKDGVIYFDYTKQSECGGSVHFFLGYEERYGFICQITCRRPGEKTVSRTCANANPMAAVIGTIRKIREHKFDYLAGIHVSNFEREADEYLAVHRIGF
jgi:hypothetical protein